MPKKNKFVVPVPEWSYPVEADKITADGKRIKIAASEPECAALTKRLGVLSLSGLRAEFVLARKSGSPIVHVKGRLEADVAQACVITTEPVADRITENFEAWFADPKQAVSFAKARHEKLAKTGQMDAPILDESEDPEPIVDGLIDLGELAVQFLSLSLEPYPHKPGAAYEGADEGHARPAGGGALPDNPFAALKAWKAKQGTDSD